MPFRITKACTLLLHSVFKHVITCMHTCYFQLRQLRWVRRSLDEESVATLVHTFVTSCIDYCNSLLAGAPKRWRTSCNGSWTPQHVSSATHVRHDILHWLDVPERVTIKLCWPSTSVHGMWPIYLSEMCRPSSLEAGRRHLRSANRGQLVIPCYRLTTAGRRAFSCAGPSAWNSFPEYLTVDTLTLDYFKRSLKCFLFARYWHSAWSALGIYNDSALYKCTLNNNNFLVCVCVTLHCQTDVHQSWRTRGHGFGLEAGQLSLSSALSLRAKSLTFACSMKFPLCFY